MEILIITVVAIVLAVVAGVKLEVIAMILPVAATVLMLAFFIHAISEIITAKKEKGRFCGFEKSGKYKFVTAVYMVDGKKCPGTFPREGSIGKLIYKKDKDVTVFLVKENDRVYDVMSCVTVVMGLVLGTITLVMTAALAASVIDFRF